jgi:hypothetical protein
MKIKYNFSKLIASKPHKCLTSIISGNNWKASSQSKTLTQFNHFEILSNFICWKLFHFCIDPFNFKMDVIFSMSMGEKPKLDQLNLNIQIGF